jgi:hypothetical protein
VLCQTNKNVQHHDRLVVPDEGLSFSKNLRREVDEWEEFPYVKTSLFGIDTWPASRVEKLEEFGSIGYPAWRGRDFTDLLKQTGGTGRHIDRCFSAFQTNMERVTLE